MGRDFRNCRPMHTRREQNRFRNAVYWKLEHPKERAERKVNAYGSGGLCNACQMRIFMRMRNRYRMAMQRRDLAQELATFRCGWRIVISAIFLRIPTQCNNVGPKTAE